MSRGYLPDTVGREHIVDTEALWPRPVCGYLGFLAAGTPREEPTGTVCPWCQERADRDDAHAQVFRAGESFTRATERLL